MTEQHLRQLSNELRHSQEKWNPTALKFREEELQRICRNNACCPKCNNDGVDYEISWNKSKWYDDGHCYFTCSTCSYQWSEG